METTIDLMLMGSGFSQHVESTNQPFALEFGGEKPPRYLAGDINAAINQADNFTRVLQGRVVATLQLAYHRLGLKGGARQVLTQAVVKIPAQPTPLILCDLGNFVFKTLARDDFAPQIGGPLLHSAMHIVEQMATAR